MLSPCIIETSDNLMSRLEDLTDRQVHYDVAFYSTVGSRRCGAVIILRLVCDVDGGSVYVYDMYIYISRI